MALVAWQLQRHALVDWKTGCIAFAAAIALLRFRLNAAWLVLGGALLGFFVL